MAEPLWLARDMSGECWLYYEEPKMDDEGDFDKSDPHECPDSAVPINMVAYRFVPPIEPGECFRVEIRRAGDD